MEFNSLIFIFLLFPVYIILMFLVKNNTFRNMYTMVYSLMFYYFGDIDYFILLLLMIMITYCFGLLMNKPNNRVYYIIYLVIVVFTLSFFKYGNYFINGMLSFLRDYKIEKIIMPLGVSFYTFTSISYVNGVEKYRTETKNNYKINGNNSMYSDYDVYFGANDFERIYDFDQ